MTCDCAFCLLEWYQLSDATIFPYHARSCAHVPAPSSSQQKPPPRAFRIHSRRCRGPTSCFPRARPQHSSMHPCASDCALTQAHYAIGPPGGFRCCWELILQLSTSKARRRRRVVVAVIHRCMGAAAESVLFGSNGLDIDSAKSPTPMPKGSPSIAYVKWVHVTPTSIAVVVVVVATLGQLVDLIWRNYPSQLAISATGLSGRVCPHFFPFQRLHWQRDSC